MLPLHILAKRSYRARLALRLDTSYTTGLHATGRYTAGRYTTLLLTSSGRVLEQPFSVTDRTALCFCHNAALCVQRYPAASRA